MTLALEELVRTELEGALRPLVDELLPDVVGGLVRERLNGAAGTMVPKPEPEPEKPRRGRPPAPRRTCRVCGETKPASAFRDGRRACKVCRAASDRERVARKRANGTAPEVAVFADDPPTAQPD